MRAFGKFFAVMLAVGGAVTLAGCSKSTGSKSTFCANWNVRTRVAVEDNSTEYWQTHKEVATYALSFTEGSNTTYTVSYGVDGAVYFTEFYIDSNDYDWSDSAIPEDYRKQGEKDTVYVFRTELTLSGEYKLSSSDDDGYAFDDKLITECKFRMAAEGLVPVYSYQEVKNTAPATLDATSLSGTYVVTEATYTTYYNYDCTQATITTAASDGTTTTSTVSFSDGYSVVDNCQIRAAIRALADNEGDATYTVCVPQTATTSLCTVSLASATGLDPEDEEQKGIIDALSSSDGYIFFNGEATEEDEEQKYVRYNEATVSALGEKMNGSSSTYWYSTVENAEANTTRRVMLKASTPLSFGLGTLNYTLKSLKTETI